MLQLNPTPSVQHPPPPPPSPTEPGLATAGNVSASFLMRHVGHISSDKLFRSGERALGLLHLHAQTRGRFIISAVGGDIGPQISACQPVSRRASVFPVSCRSQMSAASQPQSF